MARGRSSGYEVQRAAILDNAARLFAERGYPVASTAELARACGVSKALLYHYHRDKAQLLVAIADRHLDALDAVVAEVAARRLGPAARLRELIAGFMAAYTHAGAYHRVLVQDVKYLDPAARRRIERRQRALVAAFAAAIGQAAPHLAGGERLKPVTMVLFGMINWTFTWLRDDGPLTHEQVAAVVADLFAAGLPGLRAGRGAAAAARAPAARPRPRAALSPVGTLQRKARAPEGRLSSRRKRAPVSRTTKTRKATTRNPGDSP